MDEGKKDGTVRGLSAKQRRFVEELLVDNNGRQAALRAGYAPASARTAHYRLLRHPATAAAIAEARAAQSARIEARTDRILEEAGWIAFANIADYVEWDGETLRLKPSARIGRGALAAIAEISIGRDGRGRVKLHPKLPALELLARSQGLLSGRAASAMEPPETSPSPREIIDRRLAALRAIAEAERAAEEEEEAREREEEPAEG